MAKLKLKSLTCIQQEDYTGSDQPYLLVSSVKVWGPGSMRNGETEYININPIPFNNSTSIVLMEQDTTDPDDNLGTVIVPAQATGGEQSATFNGSGANYTLRYEVLQ